MAAYNRIRLASPGVASLSFIPLSLPVVAGCGFSSASVAFAAAASAAREVDMPTGVAVADSASAAPSSSSSLTAVQVKSVDSSANSVGSNVHFSYGVPHLTDASLVLQALQCFGVRHVRGQRA
jgi:hypothetical protein